jgi:ubiquitin-conjugating enzyme E2 D/E
MNSTNTKITIQFKHNGNKYKIPFQVENKTVNDLKLDIVKRLIAYKVDVKAEDIELLDPTNCLLFEEDLVEDVVKDQDLLEVQSKNKTPVNVPAPVSNDPIIPVIINPQPIPQPIPQADLVNFTIQLSGALTGSAGRATKSTAQLTETVKDLVDRVLKAENIQVAKDSTVNVVCNGKPVPKLTVTLVEANIASNSTLFFLLKKADNSQAEFEVHINCISTNNDFTVFAKETDTVASTLKKACDIEGFDDTRYMLQMGIFPLTNTATLKDYKISATGSKLSLLAKTNFSVPSQATNNPLLNLLPTPGNPVQSTSANAQPPQFNTSSNSLSYAHKYSSQDVVKGILADAEKVMATHFLPVPSLVVEEEAKEDMVSEDEKLVLRYRILQSTMYQEVKKITAKTTDTLESLSNKILTVNGYNTKTYRGCLYSQEGLPFSRSLAEMTSHKLESLLKSDDLLYVVLTPFNVDNTTLPKIPHDAGTDQVFVNSNGTHIVLVDIKTTTVVELKQKIYSKLDIPTGVQALYYGGRPLNDPNKLEDYNIQKNSTMTLSIRPSAVGDSFGFSGNFFSPSLIHTKPQSLNGIREFRSHMMSFFGQLQRDSAAKEIYSIPLMALIRDLSDNNAPLVNSIYILINNGSLKLTHKIAFEEGFLNLFSNLIFRATERPKGIENTPELVFEHTRPIFTAMLTFITGLKGVPVMWTNREQFVTFDTQCQITFKVITTPCHLRYDDGKTKICERSEIEKKIAAGSKIAGIETLDESRMEPLPELQKKLNIYHSSHTTLAGIWTPKDPNNLGKSDVTNNFNLVNWEALCNRADSLTITKIYKALDLKQCAPEYCLTVNTKGELILYQGKNKDVNKPINTYDVMDGSQESINADDVASEIASLQTTVSAVISREPAEAIMVLLDVSGSMDQQYFDTVGMKRIDAVKAFFNAFADRTMAYDFKHVISLVFFNNALNQICDFTEVLNQFKYWVDTASPGNTTLLYDSIMFAVNKFTLFKAKHPNCVRRIICLTDGEDVGSKNQAWKAARAVQDAGIVLDSFVVGPECEGLKTITFATGGYCYCPNGIDEAMRLFEGETILRADIRKKPASPPKLITCEKDLKEHKAKNFNKDLIPMQLPQKLNAPVTKPTSIIQEIASDVAQMQAIAPSTKLKRIVKEIHHYSSDPHPFIQIFPGKGDITFWKVLLKGPELTPYEGGTFVLYVTFPDNYPNEPPNVRFLTEIYHCNINSNGRICHSVFDRNYTVDTTIKIIFDCIFGLLLTPEPEDPLDNTLATEFLSERHKYDENAKKLTAAKASKNIDALMMEFMGVDSGASVQDPDLANKIKEFEDWLKK